MSHDDKSQPESVYVWWSDIDQQWRIRKWDMQPFVEGTKYTRETAALSAIGTPSDEAVGIAKMILKYDTSGTLEAQHIMAKELIRLSDGGTDK